MDVKEISIIYKKLIEEMRSKDIIGDNHYMSNIGSIAGNDPSQQEALIKYISTINSYISENEFIFDNPMKDINRLTNPSNIKNQKNLYHYTSADALANMINNNEFWLTHAKFQNDLTELTYATGLVNDAYEVYRVEQKRLGKIVSPLLSREWSQTDEEGENSPFLFSLSKEYDQLPLWIYYSNGDGYNIGFNTIGLYSSLISYMKEVNSSLKTEITLRSGEIIYDVKRQFRIVFSALIQRDEYLISGNIDKANSIEQYLLTLRYFIKKPCFQEEKEFRIVILVPKNDLPHIINHRNKSGSIIPFVKVNYSIRKQGLPISRITIGPRNKSDLARSGMISMLKFKGYDIESIQVMKSEIPLRY